MSLSEKLTADLKAAMKAKDKPKLNLLRSVKSSFKNKEIETQQPLSVEEETAVLMKMIKQRKEAADGFRKGGAEERAANEDWEAEALQSYLPPAPTDEEIESAIEAELAKIPESERSPKTMGVLMKALNEKFAGRPIDGKALSQKVRAKL
ncbi:MAG TPA: GatB/YqeY domain-containing protein [Phycisphaerales bacterium]|nr:GatB/YqeY domain-containing protein [Phycisphaerales bacterium]